MSVLIDTPVVTLVHHRPIETAVTGAGWAATAIYQSCQQLLIELAWPVIKQEIESPNSRGVCYIIDRVAATNCIAFFDISEDCVGFRIGIFTFSTFRL